MDAGIVSPELAMKLAAAPTSATETFKGQALPEGTIVLNAPEPPPGGSNPENPANPYRGRPSMMRMAGSPGGFIAGSIDPMRQSLENALKRAAAMRRAPEATVTIQEALAGDFKNLLQSSASA